MTKEIRYFEEIPGAPKAVGPYSPAVSAGGFLFLSGQVGIDPTTGALVSGGLEAQVNQVLVNLKAVLAASNLTFANVVKSTIFLADIKDFQAVNVAYGAALGGHKPARSTFAVAALPLGAVVEIEMIAALRE
jgi:2-iminobutanoate/2-iminopropanoate deaminase